MRISMTIIAGFLESGKTRFINELGNIVLNKDIKPVLILCEEGVTDVSSVYEDVIIVEDHKQLNRSFFTNILSSYKNRDLILEYNGTWPLSNLYKMELPDDLIIDKVIYILNRYSADIYLKNMPTMILEQINYCDVLILTGDQDNDSNSARVFEILKTLNGNMKILKYDDSNAIRNLFHNDIFSFIKTLAWIVLFILVLIVTYLIKI